MSKYRNIPQATKDNVLHYVNQVYDEAYELGYQRGRLQSDRDIKSAQQMIKDAIKNLRELKQEPNIRCKDCRHIELKDFVRATCKFRTGEVMPDSYCEKGRTK